MRQWTGYPSGRRAQTFNLVGASPQNLVKALGVSKSLVWMEGFEPSISAVRARRKVKPRRAPFEPTTHQLMAAQRHFPPNFLHETWRDYLYWDVELDK